MRLLCFPFSGGSPQAYRGFAQALPADVEVVSVLLPGRWTRLAEAPWTDRVALLETLWIATQDLHDRPMALFGHSMGAILAFEYARSMRERGSVLPSSLIVSGSQAPHLPRQSHVAITSLDDANFAAAMVERYRGIPAEVLAEPEMLELVLPALRADLMLHELYVHRDEAPLDCPITVWNGIDDANVTAEAAAAWQAHTTRPITNVRFPGGHFFLQPDREEIFAALRRAVLNAP